MRQLTCAFVVLGLVVLFAGCGGEPARPTGSGDTPQPSGPMPGAGAATDTTEPAQPADTKPVTEEAKPAGEEKPADAPKADAPKADAPKADDKKAPEEKAAEPAKTEKVKE